MSTEKYQQTAIELNSFNERAVLFCKQVIANRKASIGLSILVPIGLMSILAPLIVPHDPTATNVPDAFTGPGAEYLFGTDNYGRDLLSRVMMGGRTTLFLGIGSVTLALIGGVPIGLLAGYRGGLTDELLMRVMDMVISFPALILALIMVSMLAPSVTNVIIAIGIVYTPRIARIVRASTLSVKNEEFVMAAEARGESTPYILFREILPNVTSPIIVEASIRVGFAIIIGTSLSFLGLGAQPPAADWGYMIAQGRSYIYNSVWFIVWPSLFLMATVFAFNLLGDGLRDVLDPKVTSDNL